MPTRSPEQVRQELGLPAKGFIFGMVSRGIIEKGWLALLDAFQRLPESIREKCYLVLAGRGPAMSEVDQWLTTRDMADRVRVIHGTHTPQDYIQLFDVGLLPTWFAGESLPTVVIEYMTLGKPIIASRIAGIPELVEKDGESAGILVESKNVQELCLAMVEMYQARELRDRFARVARERSSLFTVHRMVQNYVDLYRSIQTG